MRLADQESHNGQENDGERQDAGPEGLHLPLEAANQRGKIDDHRNFRNFRRLKGGEPQIDPAAGAVHLRSDHQYGDQAAEGGEHDDAEMRR